MSDSHPMLGSITFAHPANGTVTASEVAILRASREKAVEQEQRTRVECNRLREAITAIRYVSCNTTNWPEGMARIYRLCIDALRGPEGKCEKAKDPH